MVGGRHTAAGEFGIVDRPDIKSVLGRVLLREGHGDGFVGCGRRPSGVGEASVVPMEWLGRRPDGLALLAGIFDDDAHAVSAIVVGEVANDPYSGMVHLNDSGDALRGSEPEHRNRGGMWHGIAVERDHFERMSRQRQAANFCRASIQNMKEDALTLLYSQ